MRGNKEKDVILLHDENTDNLRAFNEETGEMEEEDNGIDIVPVCDIIESSEGEELEERLAEFRKHNKYSFHKNSDEELEEELVEGWGEDRQNYYGADEGSDLEDGNFWFND